MSRVKPPSPRIQDADAVLRRCRQQYDQLKARLGKLDYICQGSITKRYLPCGKPSCACQEGAARYHGPYYYWTAKIGGHTKTRMLTPSLVRLYRDGIRNHRRLDALLRKMREISLRAFEAEKTRSKARS